MVAKTFTLVPIERFPSVFVELMIEYGRHRVRLHSISLFD